MPIQITSPAPAASRSCSYPFLVAVLVLISWPGLLPASAHAADRHTAEQDLLAGRADQAAAELRGMLAGNPGDGTAHLLLCRTLLSTLKGTEAAEECRLALESGLTGNSAAQDWAGRSFGAEAEHAGPISGLKLAGQVRTAFQTAYTLDRRNPAAANDLGEYFVNAPALVGGGTGKASSLADEIQPALPEIAHRLRALVAEKHSDAGTAEAEYLASTRVAQSPGAYVDLANFYVRQGALDKAGNAARRAITLDRAVDANVVDAASALMDAHQPLPAAEALRLYLNHGQQSDQAPAFRAHTMLGQIFAGQGNRADAQREFRAALGLARDYRPAQKGLGSL